MNYILGAGIILTSVFLLSCTSAVKHQTSGDWNQGQIIFIEREGGFYAIQTEGGDLLVPANLEPAYQTHGLRVCFRYRTANIKTTTLMQGIPIIISEIKKR